LKVHFFVTRQAFGKCKKKKSTVCGWRASRGGVKAMGAWRNKKANGRDATPRKDQSNGVERQRKHLGKSKEKNQKGKRLMRRKTHKISRTMGRLRKVKVGSFPLRIKAKRIVEKTWGGKPQERANSLQSKGGLWRYSGADDGGKQTSSLVTEKGRKKRRK